MRQYFKIQNKKSDERAKLYIYDQIGKDWWTDEGISDKDIIGWLADASGKPLDVHINSVGGNVYEGIAICNALKNYENDVTIYIDGIAASIASVIACASDDVRINNGATLMIHGVSGGFWKHGTAEEIKDAADRYIAAMDSCKESIIDIYEGKTGMSRDDLSALMSTDSYLSAQEAVDKGFCNEILNKKPDKSVENSLQNQMKSYPNEKMQAIVNRFFNVQNSAKPESVAEPIKPIANQGAKPMFTEEELKAQAIADFKAAENKRQSDIKAIFAGKNTELMNQCLLDAECSPENAKDKLLDNLMNAPQPNNAQPVGAIPAGVTKSDVDNKLEALQASWDNKRNGKHDGTNPMNDGTMHTALALIAQKHGIETTGYSGNQFFNLLEKDMQVTAEFSVLLSDSLNKSVEKGYALAPTTFREFVKFGSFNDFRKKEVHMLGTIGDLPLKDKENDDYKQIKLPDSEAQDYAPQERGGIIVLSRKLLVNNDLGNLETQAQDAGFSGALTLNKLFHDYLFSNPALRDGKALFHDDHGNLLPAGIPTEAALEAMQDLFDKHTAPNSPQSFLSIFADRVLADRKNLAIILELITKETGKEAKSTIDLFDRAKLFFSQRMAGQGVYFFADPNIAPVLEVGFLNGLQVPTLATEEHFNSGAMKWRLQLDCGIGAVNYRGAVWLPPEVGAEGKKLTKAQQKALEKEAEEKAAAEEAERLAAEEAAKNNV